MLPNAVQDVIAAKASEHIRDSGLLPREEKNDALPLAQAAALDCTLLLTYDSHLRDIDFQKLTLLLREVDLAAPVIASPDQVVKKFYT